MALKIPPELKKITPFIRRAEDLDRDRGNPKSRLVAFYCRQQAVLSGIPMAASSAAAKECLGVILGQLEGEKKAMSNFTRDESKLLCRKFAEEIFNKADGEDRLGMANMTTAKAFYGAATFFEVLQQFYDDDDESEERVEDRKRTVYAKWKATEILKAIKEGREPTPGGYGEAAEDEEKSDEESDEEKEAPKAQVRDPLPPPILPAPKAPISRPVVKVEESDEESEKEEEVDDYEEKDEGTEVDLLGPPPAYPDDDDYMASPAASIDRPPIVYIPPPLSPPPVAPPRAAPAPAKRSGIFGLGKKATTGPVGKVSKEGLADAVELTSFALVALQSKDVELGAARLKQALAALGQ